MYSEYEFWDKLKTEYIRRVAKALAAIKSPRVEQVLQDVRSHLDQRFAELEPGERTPETLQAIIAEMGPPSDYAELLEPGTRQPHRTALPKYLVALGLAAVVVIVGAVMLPSLISSTPRPVKPEEFRRGFLEKVHKFKIDAAALEDVTKIFGEPLRYVSGSQTVDAKNLPPHYVAVYPDGFHVFISDNRIIELRHERPGTGYLWRGKLRVGSSLEQALEVMGEPNETVQGKENSFADAVLYRDIDGRKGYCYYARADQDIRVWFADYKVRAIYVTRSDYKGGRAGKAVGKTDAATTTPTDHQARIADRIDYPFMNDPEALGTWESVDFVSEVADFKPGSRCFKGDLFLKGLSVLEAGKTDRSFTWTKGLIIHRANKTAAKYRIREINGAMYMFFEWKSGDYTIRQMKPSYYVLRKIQSDTN